MAQTTRVEMRGGAATARVMPVARGCSRKALSLLVLVLNVITSFRPSPAVAVGRAAPPSLSSYANAVEMDAKYRLFWTADTAASRPRINLAVSAKTKGFVGFGLSEVGGMVGSGEWRDGMGGGRGGRGR